MRTSEAADFQYELYVDVYNKKCEKKTFDSANIYQMWHKELSMMQNSLSVDPNYYVIFS